MKRVLTLIFSFFLFSSLFASQRKKAFEISKSEVLQACQRVAGWQLAQPFVGDQWNNNKQNDWIYSTFWTGLIKFHQYKNNDDYLKAMFRMGRLTNWEPMGRPYDANMHLITYTHCELYEITQDPAIIEKSIWMANMPLLRWVDADMHFDGNDYKYEWWTWCDALFMAPPAYARLGALTADNKYFDYMDQQWWNVSDYLYSATDSLYFRDDSYFSKKSKNGQPVFWSRGNGWVLGGLCLVLEQLPSNYPNRYKYEQQFVEMVTKVASIQTEEGFWPTSLLDPEEFPLKETSGTAFFCYAIAWGINHGYLDQHSYMPQLNKAWKSIADAVHPNGMLGNVQLVGDSPVGVSNNDTAPYGPGAFLLAGAELLKLIDNNSERTTGHTVK